MMEFLFASACNTIILISRGIAFISQDQGHPCTIPFVLGAVTGGDNTVREQINKDQRNCTRYIETVQDFLHKYALYNFSKLRFI